MLSDYTLRRSLEPSMAVMQAYKKASSWRAVREAWETASKRSRFGAGLLLLAFLATGGVSVWKHCSVCLFISLVTGALAALFFRLWIVDRCPLTRMYGKLDSHFSLGYRFRRYLMFRQELLDSGMDLQAILRARSLLTMEATLRDGRRPRMGRAISFLVTVCASVVTTLVTQQYLIESKLIYLILFGMSLVLYFCWAFKSAFPGPSYNDQELACFLEWHEHEYAVLNEEGLSSQFALPTP